MRKITKKPKLHRLIAWLLAITMLSGYVPKGVSLKGLDVFRNMGKVQAAVTLQNPTITEDSSMDAGQRVTWDCVWFGSYPQSEVTEKDGDIYNALKNATGWDCCKTLIAKNSRKSILEWRFNCVNDKRVLRDTLLFCKDFSD